MNGDDRYLNVVDVEATCWKGRPPSGQRNEIIEIGLCVIDVARRERVAKRQIMVRPQASVVSEFCTELTGHTQADVDRGVSFAEACAILAREYDSGVRPWASWGDYDRRQFDSQARAAAVAYPFGNVHTNAKKVFGAARNMKGPGMARALALAGLPLQGRHHNGADDAWNIGALVLGMLADGVWPETGMADAERTTVTESQPRRR